MHTQLLAQTHIYIYTVQQLQCIHNYWHKYIFTFILHNSYNAYPTISTNTYLHLYCTTATMHTQLLAQHIFTFILYNSYNAYPTIGTNTYLHLYCTTATMHTQLSAQTHIYIYTVQQLQCIPNYWHKHIFTFILYNSYNAYTTIGTNTYLHLYCTTATLHTQLLAQHIFTFILYNSYNAYPTIGTNTYLHLYCTTATMHTQLLAQTHIYIYTVQQLQCIPNYWHKHIFTFILYNSYNAYPTIGTNTYLHLYCTTATMHTQLFAQNTYLHLYCTTATMHTQLFAETHIYIYTVQQLQCIPYWHYIYIYTAQQLNIHIYIYTVQQLQCIPTIGTNTYLHLYCTTATMQYPTIGTNTYLHLYCTTATMHTQLFAQTHIYIYTVQQLQCISNYWHKHIFTFILYNSYNIYPTIGTNTYLHLYCTTATMHIQLFAETHIYIYTVQQLQCIFNYWHNHIFIFILYNSYNAYPTIGTNTYLHLYCTTATMHTQLLTQTHIYIYTVQQLQCKPNYWHKHIFTFILYNSYNANPTIGTNTYLHLYCTTATMHTQLLAQTHIYIYTVQQLQCIPNYWHKHIFTFILYNSYNAYPTIGTNTYLHLYCTTATMHTQLLAQTHIYIYTVQQLQCIPNYWHKHIFTFILYNSYNAYPTIGTNTYLHLYCTTATMHTQLLAQTHIYIYTVQQLQCIPNYWHKHIFTFILYNSYNAYPTIRTKHVFTFILYNSYNAYPTIAETHIYIYTIQQLQCISNYLQKHIFTFILYNSYNAYPTIGTITYLHLYCTTATIYTQLLATIGTNTYLHLYCTTATMHTQLFAETHIYIDTIQQLQCISNYWHNHIFTFILYNSYNIYPTIGTNTYLHLYCTTATMHTQLFAETHIYIYTIKQLQCISNYWHNHIFTFILYNSYNAYPTIGTNTYLHLYCTTATMHTQLFAQNTYLHLYCTTATMHTQLLAQTHIYIYTIQQLQCISNYLQKHIFTFILYNSYNAYPTIGTITYLHLYCTTATMHTQLLAQTHICIYTVQQLQCIPNYCTQTHIYIYTVQQLQCIPNYWRKHIFAFILYNSYNAYPTIGTNTYLHLYCTKATMYSQLLAQTHIYIYTVQQLQCMPNYWHNHIFTFILYNSYNAYPTIGTNTYLHLYCTTATMHTQLLAQTHIYIYTVQQLQCIPNYWHKHIFTFILYNSYNAYPTIGTNTYLHLYCTTATMHTQLLAQTHIYIYTVQQLQCIPNYWHKHIFTFILYNSYNAYPTIGTNTYLHLYCTTATMHTQLLAQTHIYIYTVQQLQCIPNYWHKHIFTFILYNSYNAYNALLCM